MNINIIVRHDLVTFQVYWYCPLRAVGNTELRDTRLTASYRLFFNFKQLPTANNIKVTDCETKTTG